jgi:hypothetical protein
LASPRLGLVQVKKKQRKAKKIRLIGDQDKSWIETRRILLKYFLGQNKVALTGHMSEELAQVNI